MSIVRLLTLAALLAFGQDLGSGVEPVLHGVARRVSAAAAPAPAGEASELHGAAAIRFVLEEPFRGDGLSLHASRRVGGYAAFDVVAADMDLDGDMDVFINWHLGGVELFENTGGVLSVLNAPDADDSGLSDQPGVPSLYARRGSTLEELGGGLAEGIHVWCEKALVWSLCLVPPVAGAVAPLVIRSNEVFRKGHDLQAGLQDGESLHEDGLGLSLSLVPGSAPRLLQLRSAFVGSDLRLFQPGAGGESWPYHVGRVPSLFEKPALLLRKPDPHGVAWVQVARSPEPELILTRGGNRGTLAPPDPPKSNRVFVYAGGRQRYRQLDTQRAPRDHSRGRGIECVDLDNDGTLELAISNKASPNAIWFLDRRSRRFIDRAPELGLNHWFGDISAWFDLDGDGRQDQLQASGSLLRVACNRGSEGFAMVEAASFGLDLGEPFEERTKGMEKTCISVFDLDADGELDVWLSSLGAAGFHRVFRRESEGFVDVTEELGLSGLEGTESTVRLDVDDDGYIDVVALGRQPLLLWNRGPDGFERIPLPDVVPGLSREGGPLDRPFAVTAADMDADGRTDLILIGQTRQVAYNRTANDNRRLIVHMRAGGSEPIGALVRLHTDDGRSLVQRYGSANKSFVSQSLQPLHFGIAAGTAVTGLEVLWPGDTRWTASELPVAGEVQLVR